MYALDPIVEFNILNNWMQKVASSTIIPNKFVRRLGAFLRQRHPLHIKLYDGSKYGLDYGDFTFGAIYDAAADQQGLPCFEISLVLNYPKDQPLRLVGWQRLEFTLTLLESLVHEYEHRSQYRNRRYRPKIVPDTLFEKNNYLSHPDEIEAYASNIAVRLFLCGLDLNTITGKECLDLWHYYKTFGKEHQVTIELLSIIRRRLNYLEETEKWPKNQNPMKTT